MTNANTTPDPITVRAFEEEHSLDRIIGRRLTAIREQSMMTVDELAVLTGLPADCLQEHERAEIPLPLTRIRRIAAALDTDAVALMSRLLFPGS